MVVVVGAEVVLAMGKRGRWSHGRGGTAGEWRHSEGRGEGREGG